LALLAPAVSRETRNDWPDRWRAAARARRTNWAPRGRLDPPDFARRFSTPQTRTRA